MMCEPTPEMIEAAARCVSIRSHDSCFDDMSDWGRRHQTDGATEILKAALAVAPSPWRPIAEASWDVTVLAIAAVKPEHVCIVCLRKSVDGVRTLYGGWPFGWRIPTHFMEIPAPPESADE